MTGPGLPNILHEQNCSLGRDILPYATLSRQSQHSVLGNTQTPNHRAAIAHTSLSAACCPLDVRLQKI